MEKIHTAVAHPWLCDSLGHMTTRYYVAMFDDASYHLLHRIFGWNGASNDDNSLGWVDARHVIDYQAEVSAGDLLEIRAVLDKVGNKSITGSYEMFNLNTGEVAASLQCIYVLFDLNARQAAAMSDDLRQQAEIFLRQDGS